MKRIYGVRAAFRSLTACCLLGAQIVPAADVQKWASGIDLLIRKAESLESRDRADLAAQVWQQVLISAPEQPEALAHLSRWAKRSGNNEEANSYLRKLRRVDPDLAVLSRLSSISSENKTETGALQQASRMASGGHYEEALKLFKTAFGNNPPSGGWSLAYYETLAKTPGGVEPALAALRKLAADHPNSNEYQLAAAKLMTYQPATRRNGIEALSRIEATSDAGGKAGEALRQALLWEKSNPAYASELKNYLEHHKDAELEAASESLRQKLAAAAAHPATPLEEQSAYKALKDGNSSEAEVQFTKALVKDQSNSRAHAGLGYVRMKTGDFSEAANQFEAALQKNPKDAQLRSALNSAHFWEYMKSGAQLADQHKWNEALTFYESALALRPNDRDALRALGGAQVAAETPGKAIPHLTAVLKLDPSDEETWCALLQARLEADGPKAALETLRSVPQLLSLKLDRNIEWKAIQLIIFSTLGDQRVDPLFGEIFNGAKYGDVKAGRCIRIAALALRYNKPTIAMPFAKHAVEVEDTVAAWEIELATLVAMNQTEKAEQYYNQLSPGVRQVAMSHASFLRTIASVKQSSRDFGNAALLLEKALAPESGLLSESERTSVKLQLAQILVELDRGEEARTMIAAITDVNPENAEAWKTTLLVLQSMNLQDQIVDTAFRIPAGVALQLGTDGDVVAILSKAQASGGNRQAGIKLLETYIARSAKLNSSSALKERLQLAWLLLDDPSASNRLYSLLDTLNKRTDLNSDQHKELENVWATWITRSAENAKSAGDPSRALSLLQKGNSMFPQDVNLERSFAGNLLAVGDYRRAFNVYSNWGLGTGSADDYAGAIAAAQAVRNLQYVDSWLQTGLAHWPKSVKLLTQAGERAQQRGDLKKAEAYWKEALIESRTAPKNMPASTALASAPPNTGQVELKTLLLGGASDSPGAETDTPQQQLPASTFKLSSYQPTAIDPVTQNNTQQLAMNTKNPLASVGADLAPKPLVSTVASDSLEDKLAGIEGRNSPYLGSNMSVWGRGGEAGFGRLLIQQASFEASTTIADTLRASLLVLPTYLSGGTASGTGDSLFGRQTTAASFGVQDAGGVAAEGQLSSNSFGLRFGMTPAGFLTHNWVGGLRIQPKDGPIAILLERDSVKDTMLSYNGGRDPESGQIWGGVMANTASLQSHWGNDLSGFYANTGYQVIDGRNVARNTALNGNVGSWWKVMANDSGSMTLGLNFSAMHYDQNLRYFTFGQGGYFSPQQYFLFNVPVRWSGHYGRRLQYTIAGSLGTQHFAEDATDYYPSDAALQAVSGKRYPAYANTGANFSFDARLNWQIAPHYLLGAFLTASNARNYTASAAGIFVKYTFQERPLGFENAAPSIPNWRGQQPFSNQ
jgi:tetratricopeptide (TPR) repeat protein